jgi:hypothetical protein
LALPGDWHSLTTTQQQQQQHMQCMQVAQGNGLEYKVSPHLTLVYENVWVSNTPWGGSLYNSASTKVQRGVQWGVQGVRQLCCASRARGNAAAAAAAAATAAAADETAVENGVGHSSDGTAAADHAANGHIITNEEDSSRSNGIANNPSIGGRSSSSSGGAGNGSSSRRHFQHMLERLVGAAGTYSEAHAEVLAEAREAGVKFIVPGECWLRPGRLV